MKYVIFERPDGTRFPMVTLDLIGHDFIAACVNARYPGIKPIAAGACSVDADKKASVWGRSVSLDLDPGEDDTYYLGKLFSGEY